MIEKKSDGEGGIRTFGVSFYFNNLQRYRVQIVSNSPPLEHCTELEGGCGTDNIEKPVTHKRTFRLPLLSHSSTRLLRESIFTVLRPKYQVS